MNIHICHNYTKPHNITISFGEKHILKPFYAIQFSGDVYDTYELVIPRFFTQVTVTKYTDIMPSEILHLR